MNYTRTWLCKKFANNPKIQDCQLCCSKNKFLFVEELRSRNLKSCSNWEESSKLADRQASSKIIGSMPGFLKIGTFCIFRDALKLGGGCNSKVGSIGLL